MSPKTRLQTTALTSLLALSARAPANAVPISGIGMLGSLTEDLTFNAAICEAQALVAKHSESFAAAMLDISLLNSLSGKDDVVRGLEAEADDFLVKPFSIAELLTHVAAKLWYAAPRAGLAPGCVRAAL